MIKEKFFTIQYQTPNFLILSCTRMAVAQSTMSLDKMVNLESQNVEMIVSQKRGAIVQVTTSQKKKGKMSITSKRPRFWLGFLA